MSPSTTTTANDRKRRRPHDAADTSRIDAASDSSQCTQPAHSVSPATLQSDTISANGSTLSTTNGVATAAPVVVANGVRASYSEEKSDEALHDDVDCSSSDDSNSDQEDDDVLVVLELVDFKNHPIFDDYDSVRIEGLDTATPMLQIGDYLLYGQLEETIGTSFYYDAAPATATAPPTHSNSSPNREATGAYAYVGQTTKRIRFTIAPPTD